MSNIASRVLSLEMLSSVHIPEIYQVKEILNVAIFRKPEDSIASLLYKQLDGVETKINVDSLRSPAEKAFASYRKYFDYATKYQDNIHIINFENATSDPVNEIQKIVNKFGIEYLEGKADFTIADINFDSNKVWKDEHDGHMPRQKNELRLEIEGMVKRLDFIQEANSMHDKIIVLAD